MATEPPPPPEKIYVIVVFKNFRSYIGLDVTGTFATVKLQIVERINRFRFHPTIDRKTDLDPESIQLRQGTDVILKDDFIVCDYFSHSVHPMSLFVLELDRQSNAVPITEHIVKGSIPISQELVDRFKRENREDHLNRIREKLTDVY